MTAPEWLRGACRVRTAAAALHAGFFLAVATLALKAAFMPPRGWAQLEPGMSCALDPAARDVFVLKDFRVERWPSGKVRQYVSAGHVIEKGADGTPSAHQVEISVNHPLRWKGAWIYQSSYDAENEAYTVLEAVNDPFLPLAVLAGAFLLFGSVQLAFRRGARPCADRSPAPGAGTRLAWVPYALAAALCLLPCYFIGKSFLRRDLMPALQSPLLFPHVLAYLVSYVLLLFAAFGCFRRAIPVGFGLMTLGLVLGAAWGKICWGDWWQYDPKEMWSLCTWLVYAAYFHFRGRVTPRTERLLLAFGAVMIVLTLTWVNLSRLWQGMHSYA